ncbi:MAG TPA: hypothetical protein VEO91_11045, partial [Candidatus Limnocylindria bacterium]|nr:hypothetical protein [Candidatus Limnocylindria bacterium]
GLPRVFRVGADGARLGTNSAVFAVDELAPRLGRTAANLRVTLVAAHDAYAESVADAAERTLLGGPPTARVSVVMRAPEDVLEATMERNRAGSWEPLRTSPSGLGGTFLAIVTEFGDFALVEAGPPRTFAPAEPSPSSGQSAPGGGSGPGLPLWLVVVAGLALAAGAVVLLVATTRSGGRRGGGWRSAGQRTGSRTADGWRGTVPRKGGGRQSGRQGRPGRRR